MPGFTLSGTVMVTGLFRPGTYKPDMLLSGLLLGRCGTKEKRVPALFVISTLCWRTHLQRERLARDVAFGDDELNR